DVCSSDLRCRTPRHSASASCWRATCRPLRTRRPAALSTHAARTPRRTRAAARSHRHCARSHRGSSPPATSLRSRCDHTICYHAACPPALGARRRAHRRPTGPVVDPLAAAPAPGLDPGRLRRLQLAGIASGFTAGAWLGAAEAPTKMVTLGLSPVVISLAMVLGVFLARWSLPALLRGTAAIGADVRQAPHLIVWAVLAGCLWAVANTLTIFAIRDIGLSIAF